MCHISRKSTLRNMYVTSSTVSASGQKPLHRIHAGSPQGRFSLFYFLLSFFKQKFHLLEGIRAGFAPELASVTVMNPSGATVSITRRNEVRRRVAGRG